jgi:hypothetical protein
MARGGVRGHVMTIVKQNKVKVKLPAQEFHSD